MTTFWTWSYRYESGILPSSYYYETREKALQALAESLNDDEGLSDEDNHQGREVVKALLPDGELFDAWIEELGCHITLLSMESWEERDTEDQERPAFERVRDKDLEEAESNYEAAKEEIEDAYQKALTRALDAK